jgi:hypothetical protein
MTDFMPEPEFVDVSDRIWAPIAKYLPHKHGKVNVSRNPEIAKEQIYDGMKKAKKSSGTRHLDPLIKGHMPDRIVNGAVHDLLGGVTLVKGKRGRAYGKAYVVRNFWASKLGWARRKIAHRFDLPKARGRRRKRRKRIR